MLPAMSIDDFTQDSGVTVSNGRTLNFGQSGNMTVFSPVLGGAKAPVKAWIKGVDFDENTLAQAVAVSALPFVFRHVALMPDAHVGIGATVGSVIATQGAVIPASVGVDIGCGMMAARTQWTAEDLPSNLHEIRTAIEAAVPHGRTNDGGPMDRGSWGNVDKMPELHKNRWMLLMNDYNRIIEKHPKAATKRVPTTHLGTLGTGNHFIEICLDEDNRVWVMLHSGSRGVGNRFGSYFIELAKKDAERWFINLPDKNLAYFPEGTENFKDYFEAVAWAQDYAKENRLAMMDATLAAMEKHLPLHPEDPWPLLETIVSCHHNYVSRENHFGKNVIVTRKGAVSARLGELGIIPGSMGAKSYIVQGLGNPESFQSCSHGAGRKMSRTKAGQTFTTADVEVQTAGVECRKDQGVVDEIPGAYKSIEAVMDAQNDLVEIVHTLRQVVCVKG